MRQAWARISSEELHRNEKAPAVVFTSDSDSAPAHTLSLLSINQAVPLLALCSPSHLRRRTCRERQITLLQLSPLSLKGIAGQNWQRPKDHITAHMTHRSPAHFAPEKGKGDMPHFCGMHV